jgi:hypothetical protein
MTSSSPQCIVEAIPDWRFAGILTVCLALLKAIESLHGISHPKALLIGSAPIR